MEKTLQVKDVLKFCIERGKVSQESCNQTHIAGVINQIRGAIWCFTGKDPGWSSLDSLKDVGDALGLDYTIKGDNIIFSDFPDL